MSLVITREDIGDPFAAMERARAFRKRMMQPTQQPSKKPTQGLVIDARGNVHIVSEAKPKRDYIIVCGSMSADLQTYSHAPADMPPGGDWWKDAKRVHADMQAFQAGNNARRIIREVSEQYGVSTLDILSPRRLGSIIKARHAVVYRMRTQTAMSFPRMGRILKRDHSSLVHSYNRTLRLIKEGKLNADEI